MTSCAVCCGEGRYPVINRYGSELYTILCPECQGSGEEYDEEAAAEKAFAIYQRSKYDAAMAEKRRALSEKKGCR